MGSAFRRVCYICKEPEGHQWFCSVSRTPVPWNRVPLNHVHEDPPFQKKYSMKHDPTALCGLCSRALGEERIQWHHLIPKTHGGKETVPMHQICHRKIHATFTEKELEKKYFTFSALLEHEDMKKFVAWVSKKDSGFYDGSDNAKRKHK